MSATARARFLEDVRLKGFARQSLEKTFNRHPSLDTAWKTTNVPYPLVYFFGKIFQIHTFLGCPVLRRPHPKKIFAARFTFYVLAYVSVLTRVKSSINAVRLLAYIS